MKLRNALVLTALLAIGLVASDWAFAAVGGWSEVSCSKYGAAADSCNQCFDGGTDYAGDTLAKAFDDTFVDNGAANLIMYRQGGLSTMLTPLQSSVQVGMSSNYGVAPTNQMVWLQQNGKDATFFFPGDSVPMAEMYGGILVTAVTGPADANKPAYRFDYTSTAQEYDWNTHTAVGSPIVHKECVFVNPRWCGDGIVSNNEQCDEGALNGTPGHCNATCTGTPPVNASCDSITVNPTSGTAPTSINVTCNATNASSYRIDCGNGMTNLTSTATCTYNDGGTYTPRCTINGSVTSNACAASIPVNPPTTGPQCSAVISGPQAFPLSSATAGLCTVGTPVNFTTNVTGVTTSYTWACSFAGNTSPQCSASFTPAGVCIPGPTNGSQTAPVSASTAGLCPLGQTVGNFTATTVGATTSYTWSCNGSSPGGACSAFATSTGVACVPGSITLPLTSAITAATANLCPLGQTVNGFTATTASGVTNYSWGCDASAVGGACSATFGTGGVVPGICGSLTGAPLSSTNGSLTTTLTCTPGPLAGATPTFAVSCGNGQSFTGATGTCNYNANGNYVATCVVNGSNPTPAACQVPVSVTSGGPGGGGPGACKQLTLQANVPVDNGFRVSYVCEANAQRVGANPNYRVDCGNGKTADSNAGSCFYDKAGTYTVACYVENSTDSAYCQKPVIVAAPGAPLPGGGGGGPGLCGNGRIDAGESCDAGSNGGAPISNGFCNLCHIGSTNPGACARGALDCPTGSTNPGGNGLNIFYRDGSNGAVLPVGAMRSIVGNGVNVLTPGDSFYVHANYPIYIGDLTAGFVNNSPGGLISGSSVYRNIPNETCIGQGSMHYDDGTASGVDILCSDYTLFTAGANGVVDGSRFAGNTAAIPAGQSSADVNPPRSAGASVRDNNFFVGLNYLIEPIPVRVSRSAVSNTAGGNAYVGMQVGYSVNSITESFIDSLRKGNFTVTSSSKNADESLSSSTYEQPGKSMDPNAGQSDSLSKFSSTSGDPERTVTINSMADFDSQLRKIGDNPNLYALAKGKVVINGNLRLTGVKTLVIEEGTLEIHGDIMYADANASWAFVIKKAPADNNAIVIDSSVKNIAGVYIVLNGNMVGTGQTVNPLAVDGSLNANISSLVNDRTFVRATQNSSALSTGVTINYSTRAFKNPPPLLSQYLDQYNLAKIAR